MLVIVANQNDEVARQLTMEWRPYPAAVLRPADLSRTGWNYRLPHATLSYAVVDGKEIAAKEITGVLTRISGVHPQELSAIVPEDRAYVATEMTAFLAAWLSSLACPVLNRPTPNCLAGPSWRREQWVHLAAHLGIPVCPVRRSSVHADSTRPTDEVVVVGNQCFGAQQLHIYARNLARAAGTDLLAVRFTAVEDGSRFFDARPVADVLSSEVSAAIVDFLCGRSQC